mmetsp:Transcript_11107/g.27744  ORF Transcript_11107/g.27744 Transcript_11107/m.27744 type:complete len:251 (-) Transcript_11107:340-1092(-)
MRLSANTFLQAALVLEIAVACVVEVVAEANRRVPDVRGLHVDRTKVTHAQFNEELAQPALRCGLLDVRARERVEAHGGLRVLRGKFNHRVRLLKLEIERRLELVAQIALIRLQRCAHEGVRHLALVSPFGEEGESCAIEPVPHQVERRQLDLVEEDADGKIEEIEIDVVALVQLAAVLLERLLDVGRLIVEELHTRPLLLLQILRNASATCKHAPRSGQSSRGWRNLLGMYRSTARVCGWPAATARRLLR